MALYIIDLNMVFLIKKNHINLFSYSNQIDHFKINPVGGLHDINPVGGLQFYLFMNQNQEEDFNFRDIFDNFF
jgi:hypothetical protein